MRRWGFRRWTRHSMILMFAGLMYIGIGIGFLNAPPEVKLDPSLKVALQWLTVFQWGIIYICCGALALLSAIWPQFSDKWGYILLTGLSSAWAAFYAMAVIFYDAPLLSLISVALWSLLAVLWWGISGMLSPEEVVSRHDSS